MKMSAKIDGVDKLIRKLDRLPAAIGRNIERRVLMEAGEIIAARARELVPVDTGNLRDSIVVSDRPLGGAFKMDAAGAASTGEGRMTVYIGPKTGGRNDGYYGHMVEFGTVKMAAQPFLRPAFDSTKGQVQSRIAGDLAAAISRAAKG